MLLCRPVLSDVVDTTTLVAQTLRWGLPTQSFDQGLCRPGNDSGEFDLVDTFQNDVIRLHWIRRGERWPAHVESTNQNVYTDRSPPPVPRFLYPFYSFKIIELHTAELTCCLPRLTLPWKQGFTLQCQFHNAIREPYEPMSHSVPFPRNRQARYSSLREFVHANFTAWVGREKEGVRSCTLL